MKCRSSNASFYLEHKQLQSSDNLVRSVQVWTCILMDYDDFNPDDEIGRATLAIKDLEHEKTEDLWLDIDTNEESEPATDSGEVGPRC